MQLESQVSELKKKLDDLRKAKSQTIVKKDKEYVSLDTPKLGQRVQGSEQNACIKEAQEQARKAADKEISKLKDELEKMKIDHAKELENLKSQTKVLGFSSYSFYSFLAVLGGGRGEQGHRRWGVGGL